MNDTDCLARTAAAASAAGLHAVLFEVGPISMTGPWVQIGLHGSVSRSAIAQKAYAHL